MSSKGLIAQDWSIHYRTEGEKPLRVQRYKDFLIYANKNAFKAYIRRNFSKNEIYSQ